MAKPYYKGPLSDHFDGLRFFNEDSVAADKGLWDVLRWNLKRRPPRWPDQIPSITGIVPGERVQSLRVTHIGHATTLLQANGLNMLIDPVYAERASPLSWAGPRRRTPPAVSITDLPKVDVVLVSHNHYDHMDLETLRALWERDRPRIIMPLGNACILQRRSPEVQITSGDWWQSFFLDNGSKVTLVPAYHWSSRRIADYRKALWCGFVLETGAGAIYLAGDTAYRDRKLFQLLNERWNGFTLALLPIGAYAPRYFMKAQHANPEEAVQIARDCGAAVALGVHWGTFPLADEPYDEPGERFIKALGMQSGSALQGRPLKLGDVWEPDAP